MDRAKEERFIFLLLKVGDKEWDFDAEDFPLTEAELLELAALHLAYDPVGARRASMAALEELAVEQNRSVNAILDEIQDKVAATAKN